MKKSKTEKKKILTSLEIKYDASRNTFFFFFFISSETTVNAML